MTALPLEQEETPVAHLMERAVEVLADSLNSDDPRVRIEAARAVIDAWQDAQNSE
jgi:hypothetical protein